ncbi:MAG TPA: ABC transporter substrate-binding protein [Candidatus Methylomirabilis sp.]|nr:ABC transporter substrate-binding protein [Candidatus Methylomirabilis sp.]
MMCWIVYVAAVLFTLIATGPHVALAQNEILIGVFGPMTGGAAKGGQSQKEAIDLAAKEVNDKGGLLGRKVRVLYGDDAGKPEEAVNIVKRFISRDNVVLILGGNSSPTSMAAAQVTREAGVPQIIISGTAQRITLQKNPWIFRSAVPDTKIVADLVDFIAQKYPNLKKFAFLYVNDDFGKGGFDSFVASGQRHGYEIVAQERYQRGDIDFTAQLTRIKASPAQALVEWSRPHEGALIAKQFKQLGMDLPRFGGDGFGLSTYIELGQDAVNGVIYATHFNPATSQDFPGAREFIAKIKSTYGYEPDFVHAEAYDAAKLAFMAIEKAGSLDRVKIRDALRTIKYDSVRGPFTFDEKGDPTLVTHVVKIVGMKEVDARK